MAELAPLDRLLRRTPRPVVLAACGALLAALAAIDLVLGAQIRLYLLYWLPVAVASWCCGRRIGIAAAAAGAGAWLSVNFAEYRRPDETVILVWNGLVTTVSLVLIALLIGALRRQIDAAVALSRRDSLTGVANSQVLEERLERELIRSARRGTQTSVLYLDLDDFKAVNDRFGHSTGDEVLRSLAEVFVGSVREIDTVARLGGDEFAVLAPDCPAESAHGLAERLRSRIAELSASRTWPLALSIGIVTCTRTGCSPAELIHAADSLMYEVKRAGKGAVRTAVLS